ncbi:ribosomal RNA-processing protein 8 [Notolabrus celidotus]|uniref:ribosomal RNA-processing protein 8 n=1 Tax=Notolabrus celidotus TaxID=1203425 RepID=UPI00149032E7|nr:ribosomal RNA-processing protein 8 [Notolabrus celidotus]
MFIEEEEWSDEQEAEVLSRTVIRNDQKNVSSKNVKPKAVGKKSLMRTLQTLGSVPDWKGDEHQQDSDSETEATPSAAKKKKKRRKKRKQAGTTEQPENGELDQTPVKEKTLTKKRKKDSKFGDQKVNNTCVGETKDKEKVEPAEANVDEAEGTDRLSRQQWRNKTKNKKKCKNKYRQEEKPKVEVKKVELAEEHKPKEEVKTDSNNKINKINKREKNSQPSAKKQGKEFKAEKRKKSEEDAKIPHPTETHSPGEEKGAKAGKGATGLKQEVGKPKEIIDEPQSPPKRPKLELSKEQSLKREKLRKLLNSRKSDHQESLAEQQDEPAAPEPEVILDRSASLRSRMEQRLESARFRYINEVLYSTTSGEARRMFKQDPEAFGIYHRGYTAQVQRWPSNPVDAIISYIQQKPPSLVVADFGCGDCKIARSVKNKVHSFDLVSTCELVTVCDMANVPLPDRSVDIAVFCLSLMGTNLADFLAEANRVLKMGGVLKVAEVASRFENVRSFITGLANLGFKMVSKDSENTHFHSFESVKTGEAPENVKKFGLQLRACLYKKR